MLTRPNVSSKELKLFAIPCIATLVIVLLFLVPGTTFAAQTIILNIRLNQEVKGEFFVDFDDDGDFRLKEADLLGMGFRGPFTRRISIAGEPYVSLKTIAGLTFSYNEKTLSLDIMALPEQLPAHIIDFTPPQPLKVYYPHDSSAFLNYRLDYISGNSFGFKSLALTNELGARHRDLLFITDSSFQHDSSGDRFVRLMSSVVYDRRSELQRFTLGDMIVSSGDLGSGVIVGGVGLSKLYKMDPYYIYHPTLNFSGLVTLPSEAEIYLDGMRIRTEQIAPGEFNLNNITGYGGSSRIEVVLKDLFGRERRITAPFYFTDALLKAGSHEYSYHVGALRENLGVSSNHYGRPAFSGFHWYGLSDGVTIGVRGEGAGSAFNLGPQGTFLIPRIGTINLSLAGSSDRGKGGAAALVAYSYQGKTLNTRLQLKGYSKDYATIAISQSDKKNQYGANAGVGYNARKVGAISFDLSSSKSYVGELSQTLSTTYSRSLLGKINLFITYRRIIKPLASDEFSIGLNYSPGEKINLSAGYQQSRESNSETVQLQKNLPIGEGTGFNISVERSDTSNAAAINRFNPSLQYNSRYGTYGAEYSYQQSSSSVDSSRLSAAGSISLVGSTIGFTRPVTDSFALVKVGEVEGVRVYQNNQEIGKTDAFGAIFIPNLGAFNYNQISINDSDVPIDYQLTRKLLITSPPYRSGSCVIFETAKLQAITGILSAKIDGVIKPLVFKEIRLILDGRTVTLQTGAGGEFYLDNYSQNEINRGGPEGVGCQALGKSSSTLINPGTYPGSVSYSGQAYPITLIVPISNDPIIDLGTIICDIPLRKETPASNKPPDLPLSIADKRGSSNDEATDSSTHKPGDTIRVGVQEPGILSSSDKPESLELEVHFLFDTVRYSSREDRAIVLTAARLLAYDTSLQVAIEGHTDQLGSDSYNLKLGKRRGAKLVNELLRMNVDRNTIVRVTSFGKRKTKCSEPDRVCRQQNRRGVIRIINR